MSFGIVAVEKVDGVAVVRVHSRSDSTELVGVTACWRALQSDPAIRAVGVVSVSDDFGAAMGSDDGG